MQFSASRLIGEAKHFGRTNSPAIFAGFAIAGTITTAYLTAVSTIKAVHKIQDMPDMTGAEEAKNVWKFYIPPAISGTFTIGCIVASVRAGNRRTAAVAAAYSITEKAFEEYRDRVLEKFGESKEQAVRDELVEARVRENPPKDILVTGKGEVLCCELFTGRYFKSSMEALRKAQNDINAQILSERYVTLSEFYYAVELPITSVCNNIGWDSDKLLELKFTAVISPDGEPCLSFDYNYLKDV